MNNPIALFDEHKLLHDLKHYLPAQAPLKDFIHHNSLHAFQTESFFEALKDASDTFGYRTYLSLTEYRKMYQTGRIHKQVTAQTIAEIKGEQHLDFWLDKMINQEYDENVEPKIGALRGCWKTQPALD